MGWAISAKGGHGPTHVMVAVQQTISLRMEFPIRHSRKCCLHGMQTG